MQRRSGALMERSRALPLPLRGPASVSAFAVPVRPPSGLFAAGATGASKVEQFLATGAGIDRRLLAASIEFRLFGVQRSRPRRQRILQRLRLDPAGHYARFQDEQLGVVARHLALLQQARLEFRL